MPKLKLLVGPPGSGKSSYCSNPSEWRVSQDDQGKEGHLKLFNQFIENKVDIIVDRMNFSVGQRRRYLDPAKAAGYETEIIVLHEPYDVCFKRCVDRIGNHPTITTEQDARNALHTFFTKYERVEDSEADTVTRLGWDKEKPDAIVCDLDGTLCNTSHREHFLKGPTADSEESQKKDWKMFFKELVNDSLNSWCYDILDNFSHVSIVLASGRPDDFKRQTEDWLEMFNVNYDNLFMRKRNDYRKDDIVKEIILDFEILTRYNPLFFLDDRTQVVKMWRKRGFVCLQCAEGNF